MTQDRTGKEEDKTRQDKTRQDKTRQENRTQDKRREEMEGGEGRKEGHRRLAR